MRRRLRPLTTARPGWVVLAVLTVLVIAALFGDRGVLHLWRLRADVHLLRHEVQGLEIENERLAKAIADLQDNPSVIERIAREELGLVRPGERVLRFPKSSRPADPPGAAGFPSSSPPRSP